MSAALLLVALVIVVIAGAYRKGRQSGASAVEASSHKETLNHVETAQTIRDDVAAAAPDDARNRLSGWSRR